MNAEALLGTKPKKLTHWQYPELFSYANDDRLYIEDGVETNLSMTEIDGAQILHVGEEDYPHTEEIATGIKFGAKVTLEQAKDLRVNPIETCWVNEKLPTYKLIPYKSISPEYRVIPGFSGYAVPDDGNGPQAIDFEQGQLDLATKIKTEGDNTAYYLRSDRGDWVWMTLKDLRTRAWNKVETVELGDAPPITIDFVGDVLAYNHWTRTRGDDGKYRFTHKGITLLDAQLYILAFERLSDRVELCLNEASGLTMAKDIESSVGFYHLPLPSDTDIDGEVYRHVPGLPEIGITLRGKLLHLTPHTHTITLGMIPHLLAMAWYTDGKVPLSTLLQRW